MKSSLHRIESIRLDLAPTEVAARCRHLPGLIFFDSALQNGGDRQTVCLSPLYVPEIRFSIIAACPSEMISGCTEADWEQLKEKLKALDCGTDRGCGFPTGMAAGYVEYDGRFTLGIYYGLLVFEHSTRTWQRVGQVEWWDQSADPVSTQLADLSLRSLPAPDFASPISREEFCQMVGRAKQYIGEGDIYQVNLSHRFTAQWNSDPWSFYEKLRRCSPAPHAAYVELGGKTLLSSSPELFLRMSGSQILTKPIKGTRPRFADPLADAQSARDLIASQKESAELVMITDLERNDLGRSCEFGSVAVTELLKMERYAQVFHLVSTVQGRLRAGVDHVTALQACFPGGSITGAPKKRAMEIIAELEPVPRGVYTGAIGYFGFNGESQFSIAIRTVTIEKEQAQFHVGAGIVADSDPELEYEETLHKAAGILLAAEGESKKEEVLIAAP